MMKVKDRPDLVRDATTNSIINTNMEAYKSAVEAKRKARAQRDKIEAVVEDVHELKQQMADIKELLIQLTKGKIDG